MKTYRHIWGMVFVACFCLGISLSWAEDGYRVFIGTEGRSISGKLVGYNPDEQIATIKRNDDKKFRVSLDVFSETDQQYIREQGPVENFMYSLRIQPILREFDTDGKGSGECVKSLGYSVVLENCSLTPFEAVEIEYCLFYYQEERRETRMKSSNGVQCGRWKLDSMVPGARHVQKTKVVLIRDEEYSSTTFGDRGNARGAVQGIWLRISATLPSGDRVSRDFRSPGRIDTARDWTTTTVPVGLNKCAK